MMEYMIRGTPVWFDYQRGVIRGQKQWHETTFFSHNQGNSFSSRNVGNGDWGVSSFIRRYQTFWIVSPNGKEVHVGNIKFKCRDGQEAILIRGGKKGDPNSTYLMLYNINSQQSAYFGIKSIFIAGDYVRFLFREFILYVILYVIALLISDFVISIGGDVIFLLVSLLMIIKIFIRLLVCRKETNSALTAYLHDVLKKEGISM
ncbi:hypothetical protein [Bombella sp. ESL0385]|uniref:hypothetical protein n=1 Tax=Bombella sp. ESL0385 TaxID=2676446 RepID=UPI0012D9F9C3|nr:hypothetical protein [Bombella sp. ESL0385]MUG90917.1 hypothetical protein [Bombella sp. ESL0385]